MASRVRLEPAAFGEESSCYRGRIETIAELEPLDYLGEADLNLAQSEAMAVGIDGLLVKSIAFINHRFDAIDHRFNALEHAMRLRVIGMLGVMVAILLGFAGLIYAMSG